ncbi:asparaginase [Virgibacillus sp. C22-A2]|uniref:Asparaginase n=1 Tax=Virgibacillus tibetensis TaxID=3042313 RepID=A0ABU6KFD7_9BACI|nr:asparaginase [Virgibacillus sp. C22-A2]
MKKIALITLGGTISAKGLHRGDLKDYQSGLLGGNDFLNELPELSEMANIEVVQIDNVSSTQINENHWIKLKKIVEYYLNEQNFDGVVITHGTNTIEETAYFLHLTVDSNKPVVLVGAQRPFTALSTDAHLNLIQAVRVAIDPNSSNKGVLVAINNEINCARDVTKTNTYRLETFRSGETGYLGFIDPDETVRYYRTPIRRHTINSEFSKTPITSLAKIEIVYSYAGASGELINFITQSKKYDGIVIAGTGAGRFSQKEEKSLYEARKNGLHIVRSSRVGNGRVLDIASYRGLKAVSGDNLSPQKARILLLLSLLQSNDVEEIQRIFNEY